MGFRLGLIVSTRSRPPVVARSAHSCNARRAAIEVGDPREPESQEDALVGREVGRREVDALRPRRRDRDLREREGPVLLPRREERREETLVEVAGPGQAEASGENTGEADFQTLRQNDLAATNGSDLEASGGHRQTNGQHPGRLRGQWLRRRAGRGGEHEGNGDCREDRSHLERPRTVTGVPIGVCW